MGYIDTIRSVARNRTTYRIGLLQARVFRTLKDRTNRALAEIEEGISSVHWAFLGLVYESKEGIRPGEAAQELGVEAAFVTVLINELEKKGFIEVEQDGSDNRKKIVHSSAKGRVFVSKTEKELRNAMQGVAKGLSMRELGVYIAVLERIVENTKHD